MQLPLGPPKLGPAVCHHSLTACYLTAGDLLDFISIVFPQHGVIIKFEQTLQLKL